jgi:hypothetical protein
MKLTKKRLKQIIIEEYNNLFETSYAPPNLRGYNKYQFAPPDTTMFEPIDWDYVEGIDDEDLDTEEDEGIVIPKKSFKLKKKFNR